MSFAQNLVQSVLNADTLPYTVSLRNELTDRRARFSDGLGIDRLLAYAGTASVYPPSSSEAVHSLIGAIDELVGNRLRSSRAIYYIFLDFSPASSAQTIAQYYASQIWLNENERKLVEALWLLDRGDANSALAALGYDFDLSGNELLHEYIVLALALDDPQNVAPYLAARGLPGTYMPELAQSLALRGKFFEVLEIARATDNIDAFSGISVPSSADALELAQLPCTADEWSDILAQLGESELVRTMRLVRALHLGDKATLDTFSGDVTAQIFIKKATLA